MNAGNKNTQHAPPKKTECDSLNGRTKKKKKKKGLRCTRKISPKMVNPRDIPGNAEEGISGMSGLWVEALASRTRSGCLCVKTIQVVTALLATTLHCTKFAHVEIPTGKIARDTLCRHILVLQFREMNEINHSQHKSPGDKRTGWLGVKR